MIVDPSYTYRRTHFTSRNASFCDICLPACLIPVVHSILGCRRKFIFSGKLPIAAEKCGVIWDQKVEVTSNENLKIVFRPYRRQKWIDLCQMITGTFHQRKCFVFSRAYATVLHLSVAVCRRLYGMYRG